MFSEIINVINEDVKDIEVVRKYLKSYNKKFNEKFKNIHIEHLTECNQYLKKIEDLLNNYPVQNHLIRDSLKQIVEINDKIKTNCVLYVKKKLQLQKNISLKIHY